MTILTSDSVLAGFAAQPSMLATPAAIASLIGHGVAPKLVGQMLANAYLRKRLDAALYDCLGPIPDLSLAQMHVAGLDAAKLTRLALRAGAVWHATHIAKAHDGPTVRALVERIGAEFRDTALADLAAFGPITPPDTAVDITFENLPTAIARDGTACLVAWCEQQPKSIGWRILLRLRINVAPGPRHSSQGPSIVERLTTPGATAASA